jgi:hypothetical protein
MKPATRGSVSILNVGEGDTKLSFDPSNPAERIRAARIVKDMLRRGYALLVEAEVDGRKVYQRATDFREDVCEYIIADLDPTQAAQADRQEQAPHENEAQPTAAPSAGKAEAPKRRGRPPKHVAVAAERASVVAVAPIAGG